jgi:hypothetical protein
LEGAKRAEVALGPQHGLDRGRPERADQFVLQVDDAEQGALAESKAHPPQRFFDERGPIREERQAKAAWEAFRRDVAHASVAEYSPEIRVHVHDVNDRVLRFRLATAPADEEIRELPAAASAKRIGEVVLRLPGQAQPDWAAVGSAALLTDRLGGLVVHPYRGIFAAGPVRRLGADADESTLASAIRAALEESGPASDDRDRGGFARALAETGLEQTDVAAPQWLRSAS